MDDFGAYPFLGKTLGTPKYWYDCLELYVGNKWVDLLFRCPDYKGPTRPGDYGINMVSIAGGSYGYNAWGTGDSTQYPDGLGLGPNNFGADTRPTRTTIQASIKAPSDMIALGDAKMYGIERVVMGFDSLGPHLAQPALVPGAWPAEKRRHQGKFNVSFCDGHIETMKWHKFHEPSDSVRRRWNFDNEPHPETWDRADDKAYLALMKELGL